MVCNHIYVALSVKNRSNSCLIDRYRNSLTRWPIGILTGMTTTQILVVTCRLHYGIAWKLSG